MEAGSAALQDDVGWQLARLGGAEGGQPGISTQGVILTCQLLRRCGRRHGLLGHGLCRRPPPFWGGECRVARGRGSEGGEGAQGGEALLPRPPPQLWLGVPEGLWGRNQCRVCRHSQWGGSWSPAGMPALATLPLLRCRDRSLWPLRGVASFLGAASPEVLASADVDISGEAVGARPEALALGPSHIPGLLWRCLGGRRARGQSWGASGSPGWLRLIGRQSAVCLLVERANGLLQEEQTGLLVCGQEVVAAVSRSRAGGGCAGHAGVAAELGVGARARPHWPRLPLRHGRSEAGAEKGLPG